MEPRTSSIKGEFGALNRQTIRIRQTITLTILVAWSAVRSSCLVLEKVPLIFTTVEIARSFSLHTMGSETAHLHSEAESFRSSQFRRRRCEWETFLNCSFRVKRGFTIRLVETRRLLLEQSSTGSVIPLPATLFHRLFFP